MTTLAERGRTAHRYGVTTAARETVTFQRGTKTCTIEDAIRTEASYDVQGPDGLMTQVATIDWFLPLLAKRLRKRMLQQAKVDAQTAGAFLDGITRAIAQLAAKTAATHQQDAKRAASGQAPRRPLQL